MAEQVSLTPDELYQAAIAGIHRHITCIRANTTNDQNWSDPNHAEWTTHIEGAAAELAVAKLTNRYPTGLVFNGSTAKADVGKNLHIRSTTRDDGALIIRDRDPDHGIFVLVTGHAPNYSIHGWIKGKDAKQEAWLRAPGGGPPAYFVPRTALTAVPGR